MNKLLISILFVVAIQAATYNDSMMKTYGTIADLVTHGNPSLKPNSYYQTVNVQGYWTPGDGGGGMFTITNTMTGTNTGTLIYSGKSGLSWLRIDKGPMSVRWFGATGIGLTNDYGYILSANGSLGPGGTLMFPKGDWTCNIANTNQSGVIYAGEGGSAEGNLALGSVLTAPVGTVLRPYFTNLPVIQVGGGTNYVRNVIVRDMAIVGSTYFNTNISENAVSFLGGAVYCDMVNVSTVGFKGGFHMIGGATNPGTINTIIGGKIKMVGNTNAGPSAYGVWVEAAPAGGSAFTYTTDLKMDGHCYIAGGGSGHTMIIDGVEMWMGNTYVDQFGNPNYSGSVLLPSFLATNTLPVSYGVLLENTDPTRPFAGPAKLHGIGDGSSYLDGGWIQVEDRNPWISPFAAQNSFSWWAPGVAMNGYILYADGTNVQQNLNGTLGTQGQYNEHAYNVEFGPLYFREPGYYGGLATTNAIAAGSGGTLQLYARTAIEFIPGGTSTLHINSTNPGINFTVLGAPVGFPSSSIIGSVSNITINPPVSTNSVVITGAGFTANAAGTAAMPNLVVTNLTIFGGEVHGMNSNIVFRATNEVINYSDTGTVVANSTTGHHPVLFLYDSDSTGLGNFTGGATNITANVPVSGSGSFVVGGNLEVSGTTHVFIPPRLTKVQKTALTPVESMTVFQTDNTPGLRIYQGGAWVMPSVVADP